MKSLRLTAWTVLAALAIVPAGIAISGVASAKEQIIARKDLFGNPERAGLQVSPDGKWMSYLAPRDGVLNVWVAPYGKLDEARPLTSEKTRPIRQHFWSASGEYILYVNDVGGDENFLLFRADPKTGESKNLTDFAKTRVFVYGGSWERPDELVIGLNNRDPKWHDPYLLNVKTGELKLLHENKEQYDGFVVDDSLTVRFATKTSDDAGQDVFKISEDWTATPFTTIPSDDVLTTGIAGLTSDGKTLYMIETRERDKAALVAIDLASNEKTVIGESNKADVDGTISDPLSGRALAFGVDYIKSEWHSIDPVIQTDIDYLNSKLQGQWNVASQTKDNNVWVLVNDTTTEPVSYYTYNRTSKAVDKVFTTRPNLENAPLSPMYGEEIQSRDGKTLVSYLTLPLGSDADNDGKPDQPLPLVLNVHGGPWSRDTFGYDPEHQWLANRGYAVLAVNYRGSTGFGKGFINAADREWGGKMHDDLLDAVKWAVDSGITTADKVAIYGGSYGGYATLVGMTFTPW